MGRRVRRRRRKNDKNEDPPPHPQIDKRRIVTGVPMTGRAFDFTVRSSLLRLWIRRLDCMSQLLLQLDLLFTVQSFIEILQHLSQIALCRHMCKQIRLVKILLHFHEVRRMNMILRVHSH